MTSLTKNQWRVLGKLGRKPIGFHFAENRSESAILSPLVRSGLVRKSWSYGQWMYILTDEGISTLEEWQ